MKNQSTPVLDPPAHLTEKSQLLWAELVKEEVTGSARQSLLLTALECLDRAEEARRVVAEQGMVSITETTKAAHAHPLMKIERENKQLFSKIMGQLGLALPKPMW